MTTRRILFSIFLILFANTGLFAATTEETTTTTVETTTPAAAPAAAPAATPDITTPAPSPASVKGNAMIVSPVPSAKEEIATPDGYVNCFSVEAGWYKNAWIPEHRVCQYENVPGQTVTYEGVAWIESYWACTQYTGTTCTKWEWKPGHWVKTLEVY